MFKILLVEDEVEKVRRILQVLERVMFLDVDAVETVVDANDAKKSLKTHFYDLVILDIAIPLKKSQSIDPQGGLILLKEILTREGYNIPSHIIGLTAKTDEFDNAEAEFKEQVLTVIKFDESSDEWESSLLAGIQHRVSSKQHQLAIPNDYNYDFAIVCALKTELQANLDNGWGWERIDVPNDDTLYYQAVVNNKRVIAASAFRMGLPSAASLTSKVVTSFRPRFLIMTGIMAGVSGKTNLGDVIVANPIWDWGSGKWATEISDTNSETNSSIFHLEPYQYGLDTRILKIVNILENDSQFLFDLRRGFGKSPVNHDIKILNGPVASGASVLANKEKFKEIIGQHRKLLGIEMEGYGVLCAADFISRPKPVAFCIKTVVDYGDKEKDDDVQDFGCYASAKVAQKIIHDHLC